MTRITEVEIPAATDASPLRAVIAVPDTPGPHPGVLVLHDILGVTADTRRIVERFAAAGYAAVAPDYLDGRFRIVCVARAAAALRSGSGGPLPNLEAVRTWLSQRSDVDAGRLGVVGFCMGGGFAVLHAAQSDVHVVATFYGDVPKQAEALRSIPPCVAGYGGRDRVFGPQADRLRSHLTELGVEHEVTTYADAGHGYMNDHPTSPLLWLSRQGPTRFGYDADVAELNWQRLFDFFDDHLA